MEINKLIESLEIFIEQDLSPNGLYLLFCIKNKKIPSSVINTSLEIRKLEISGYVSNMELTEKGKDLFGVKSSKQDYNEFLKTYRELFPKGKVFGYYKRDSIPDLKERFDRFFKKYDYNQDLVLKATEKYIEDERVNSNWRYLKNSAFVIEKKGEPCLLAKLCEEFYNPDNSFVDFTDE